MTDTDTNGIDIRPDAEQIAEVKQNNGTRIVRLQAENVKRLRAVSVTPTGNLVVVGGRNAQGKSSLLDSIMYALAGGRSICGQPLRKDATKGLSELTLSNGLTVKRTFTPKGGQLTVTKPDGTTSASPQAILDALTGDLTFDPLAFLRMDRRKQLASLQRIVGLDFSEVNSERAGLEATRAAAGRDVKGLKSQLGQMPYHPDAPAEVLSISELLREVEEAETANEANRDRKADLRRVVGLSEKAAKDVVHAKKQIAQWQNVLKDALADHAKHFADSQTIGAVVAGMADVDLAPIREKIDNAEAINAQVRANESRANVEGRLTRASAAWNDLDAKIKAIDESKAAAIAAAEMPVAGLAFDESTVLYNQIPLDQASGAEQLRISCAMASAESPELRIILIRDASLLDDDSMRLIAEFADANDYQVWLERVGEGDECQVVIEDGCVAGQMAPQDQETEEVLL